MKLKNHLGKCMNFNVPALHGFVPSFKASILRFTTSETQKHKEKTLFFGILPYLGIDELDLVIPHSKKNRKKNSKKKISFKQI